MAGSLEQETILQSGDLQPVIDVSQIAAASQPGLPDQGAFFTYIANVHAAGSSERVTLDPYNPTVAANLASTLAEALLLLRTYDVWLMAAGVTTSVPAVTTHAALAFDVGATTPTINTTGTLKMPIAAWTSFIQADTAGIDGVGVDPMPLQRIGARMPRQMDGLAFDSLSTDVTTVTCILLCELVPKGLRPSVF